MADQDAAFDQLLCTDRGAVSQRQRSGAVELLVAEGALAERRFHVGISIDGPARLHDACRTDKAGRPTHELVVRALRLLQRPASSPMSFAR